MCYSHLLPGLCHVAIEMGANKEKGLSVIQPAHLLCLQFRLRWTGEARLLIERTPNRATRHTQSQSLWYRACDSVESVMHKCTHACWVCVCVWQTLYCLCWMRSRLLHRTGIRLQMDQHIPILYRHRDTTGSASYSDSLLGRLIANTSGFVAKHCKWMGL